jgi:hypothetical protein
MPKILETVTWIELNKAIGWFSFEVQHYGDAQHVRQQLHKRVPDPDLKAQRQLGVKLFSLSGERAVEIMPQDERQEYESRTPSE